MNKKISLVNFVRPGFSIFPGFILLLVMIFSSSGSQSPLLINYFKEYLWNNSLEEQDTLSVSRNNLYYSISYDDIYNKQVKNSFGSIINSDKISRLNQRVGFTINNGKGLKFNSEIQKYTIEAKHADHIDNLSFKLGGEDIRLSVTTVLHSLYLDSKLSISLRPDKVGELSSSQSYQSFFSWLVCNGIVGRFSFVMSNEHLNLGFSGSTNAVDISDLFIGKEDNENLFRIPTRLSSGDLDFTLRTAFKSSELSISFGPHRIWGDTALSSGEILPLLIQANGTHVELSIVTKLNSLSTALEWYYKDLAMSAQGYTWSDSTRRYSSWLVLKPAPFYQNGMNYSCSLFEKYKVTLFGDRLTSGNKASGHIEGYPFSSWALFDPRYYKVDSLGFVISQAGVGGEYLFKTKNLTLKPSLALSQVFAGIDGNYRKRKIVILIPSYGSMINASLMNEKFFLAALNMSFGYKYGSYLLQSEINQVVPFTFNKSGKSSANATSSEKKKTVTRGGTRVSGTLKFAF